MGGEVSILSIGWLIQTLQDWTRSSSLLKVDDFLSRQAAKKKRFVGQSLTNVDKKCCLSF